MYTTTLDEPEGSGQPNEVVGRRRVTVRDEIVLDQQRDVVVVFWA